MCDRVRNRRGQTVPNYPGLCHGFSHSGPQSSPSLNKIVVFDDLCEVKEMGHYQELPLRLKIVSGQKTQYASVCFPLLFFVYAVVLTLSLCRFSPLYLFHQYRNRLSLQFIYVFTHARS